VGHLANLKPNQVIYPADSSMVKVDQSKSFSSAETMIHNDKLSVKIQGDMASESNGISSQGASRQQTRVIYVGILTAIVTICFRTARNGQITIEGYIPLLIVSMYGVDVHLADLTQRSIDHYYVQGRALEELVNLEPDCTKWYVIRQDYMKERGKFAEDSCQTRKAYNAFRPSLDQSVFYIAPLLFASFSFVFREWRRSKKPNNDSSNNKSQGSAAQVCAK
jgi:hypothetical protein